MEEKPDAHALFQSIVATFRSDPHVGLGKMLKAEALQVSGKSFAYPMDDAIVFKLPKSEVDALEAEGRGARLVVGKRTMKEWVIIPASDGETCQKMARAAYSFLTAR